MAEVDDEPEVRKELDFELRLQVLQAAVRDRQFLTAGSHDFRSNDFTKKEERVVIDIALEYWDKYGEPVGAMLRHDAETKAKKYKLTRDEHKLLMKLVDKIQTQAMHAIPVQALIDRVGEIRASKFWETKLLHVLEEFKNHTISSTTLQEIYEEANKTLDASLYVTHSIFDKTELENRIIRRQLQSEQKAYPLLLIDPIDEKIKIIGRGMFGLWVGPYSSGKSFYLLHTALAYALQGYKVLYFTLEDPRDVLENRFDACITGVSIEKLNNLPNRIRKRFRKMMEYVRGNIRVVDATEGGFTISKAEKVWEQEKAKGFEADCVVIDYDEEIECEKKYTGEMSRKREFEEIYRRLRRMAKKLDIFLWTACQTKRSTQNKKIITGDDIGEDISKAKKAFIAIGIGTDPERENTKHLYIMRHRLDRSRFGVNVRTNLKKGIAYDREATLKPILARRNARLREETA